VGDTLQTIDSLIYDGSGNLSSIFRKSSDISKNGTVAISTNSDGSVGAMSYLGIQYSPNGYNCHSPTFCGSYSTFGRSDFAYSYFFGVTSDNRTSQLDIQDIGDQQSLYSFHPFMVLGDQFALGRNLLLIYMIDWWANGGVPAPNNAKNGVVSFNFNYGR
jgi:hypothetical protein